jgi:hypothetical protein
MAGHPLISPDVLAGFGFVPMVIGETKLMGLRDMRGQLVADARSILDKAEGEKRSVTPEEDAEWEAGGDPCVVVIQLIEEAK